MTHTIESLMALADNYASSDVPWSAAKTRVELETALTAVLADHAARVEPDARVLQALKPMELYPWTIEHVKNYPRKAASIINAALGFDNPREAPEASGPAVALDLHAAIMSLPCKSYDGTDAYTHYCRGHRDARHAAAELVSAAASPLPDSTQKANAGVMNAALADSDRTVHLILFDDNDMSPEIVIGHTRAAYRFGQVSVSWNAHLFGKIKSNCRDDPRCNDNIKLALAASPVAVVPDGWVLVPIEPTPEMLNDMVEDKEGFAVYKCVSAQGVERLESDMRSVYESALAAAPSIPKGAEPAATAQKAAQERRAKELDAWIEICNSRGAKRADEASAEPVQAPTEQATAEQKLAYAGVFKGAHGLRGLLDAKDFWDKQPYGTRLYYGDDYLHRGILATAVKLLDAAQPSPLPQGAAPTDEHEPEPWGVRDDHCCFLRTFKTERARDEYYSITKGRYVEPVLFGPVSSQGAERCPHCNDTGDVHRADGEWLGVCSCKTGQTSQGAAQVLTDAQIEALAIESGFGFMGKLLLYQGNRNMLLRFARALLAQPTDKKGE